MTESAPEAQAAAGEAPVVEAYTGLTDLVTTGDHKSIGMMYVRLALVFAVGLLGLGAVVGFEAADLTGAAIFTSTDQAFQFWT
ncbi:MAG: hypothetical protein HKN26_12955, partial [Acidimicrobiales bacterium]|nr:hypothetical protein [Acidimicrobiales bacterium]